HAGHTVGAVLERYPELLPIFVAHGFTMLSYPKMRNSIARVVTIGRACRRTGVDADRLIGELNAKLSPEPVPVQVAAATSACHGGPPGPVMLSGHTHQ